MKGFAQCYTMKVLNMLENDEDNIFSWRLTQSQDILTVSCKHRAKNSQQSQGRQQGNWMYYCETSKVTSSGEEQISLCVDLF